MHTSISAPRQVLLRLPEDLAAKLARAVPPRQRNRFLVELLRKKFEEEDAALAAACEYMNEIEAQAPELLAEAKEWDEAALTAPAQHWDAGFDHDAFEREFARAQAQMQAQSTPKAQP